MNFNQLGQGKGFLEFRKYLKKKVSEGFRSFDLYPTVIAQ